MASRQRVICVTGATSGIGKATAERFYKEGWKVIITGRRRERLAELALKMGDACLPLAFDVSDKKAVFDAFANIPDAFKPIDVLVNNAGLAAGLDPVQTASLDDWESMVNANILGLLYCTKAVAADMSARGSGHIVNISSIAAYTAYKGAHVYGASKAFVSQFSRNLRSDLHGTGVRVSNIEPGLLESEFSIVRYKGDKARADGMYEGTDPLTPEDVADIIYYVANVPPHVNIGRVQVTPVSQSETGMLVAKKQ